MISGSGAQTVTGARGAVGLEPAPPSIFINESVVARLSPLACYKYYRTPGQILLFNFISDFLGVPIVGFQPGHAQVEDQILWIDEQCRSTLCVPTSIMLESMETAREIIQARVTEKRRSFLFSPISLRESREEGIAFG